MITVHATKKLLAKQPARKDSVTENSGTAAPGKLGSWHANLLTIQRRNCLLFVHDRTRFPVFIPALTKADMANIDRWFEDSLMNTLLKCQATQEQLDTAAALLQPLSFEGGTDRSILGTMNQIGQDLEHTIYFDSINVADMTGYQMSAWLAERPCTVKSQKEFILPKQAFLDFIDEIYPGNKSGRAPGRSEQTLQSALQSVSQPTVPDNVVMLDLFRNDKDD